MIIIPEIQTVVLLVPRTGSGSTYKAVLAKYPQAMLIYRHMEADGVPAGYDQWARAGVVRHPVERLWSLYKFMRSMKGDHDPAYIAAMRRSVDRPFEDWLLNNEVPFTTPYDSAHRGRYWPQFTVRHPLPENRKSQRMYLRPDLGTELYNFDHLDQWERRLGVRLGLKNATDDTRYPVLSSEASSYVEQTFAWDFAVTRDSPTWA